jgi:hypothetical protein
MRARWIREEPSKSHIGFAVVARWRPGRYYLVSTISCDGSSHLAKLTRSLETGIPFEQIKSVPSRFVTNIFRCNRNGIARDIGTPLHEIVYTTLEDAQAGHANTVRLLAGGELRFIAPEIS